MKKTKIVCTIGPACDSVEKLCALILAGMDVARINLSHGSIASHLETIQNIKTAREKMQAPIGIMADTKGPEIRIKNFENGFVMLKKNRIFTLTTEDILGNEKIVSLSYKQLIDDIKIGDKIFANNGMIVLKVKQITATQIVCKVLFGGKLTNGKGLNICGITPKGDYLSDNDKADLKSVCDKVDMIAASFVSKKQDIVDIRKYLASLGASDLPIIAKIENGSGVKNLEEIIVASDGLMIARGDLGVEIPLEQIPAVQKRAIKLCNKYGKPAIVATEMLESMTNSIRPTRAEVSDVANAVYEKASATMLSGETAVGKYPILTVKTMCKIIKQTEKDINYNKDFLQNNLFALSVADSIAYSCCDSAVKLKAKLIAVFTTSGASANLVAKNRTKTPIFALSSLKKTYYWLSLAWGVTPVLCPKFEDQQQMLDYAKSLALAQKLAITNDKIIVQIGTPNTIGKTDTIKILTC